MSDVEKEESDDEVTEVRTTVEEERIGCEHYRRKCSFIAPCCKKEYTCRICHDNNETHEINRRAVKNVKCLKCQLIQEVQGKCEGCGVVFGEYFCATCRLFDDDTSKGQFHCDGCGLCRIGGREKFFHCPKCDMCLSITLKSKHKCIEESSRRNCAVCLEDLHTSRIDAHIPPCGHLIHRICLHQCIKTGNYACPTCGESMIDMKEIWKQVDEEIAQTKMPEEYKDYHVQILCKDCHKESRTLFHVLGLKCQECGSYNTCRAAEPGTEGLHESETVETSESDPLLPESRSSSLNTMEGAVGGLEISGTQIENQSPENQNTELADT